MTALQLDDIQGNVLRGYGFPEAAYVNLQVADARDGRRLLEWLRHEVTPAKDWGATPRSALNIAVSHRGLRQLGVPADVLGSFPYEFRIGMAARARRLVDLGPSVPSRWEPGLKRGQIHLLVSLHACTRPELADRLRLLRERVRPLQGVMVGNVQRGRIRRAKAGWPRENFGYHDGFSQPAIRGGSERAVRGQGVPSEIPEGDWRPLEPGEFILGYDDEDRGLPEAPMPPYDSNGTFMVYRKLSQDVTAFRELVAAVAAEHFDGDFEFVAAKLAGRWRDGSPLALEPWVNVERKREELNAFRYGGDPLGRACPLGAHIRRANPRDGLPGGAARTRRHRIIRRGIPYRSGNWDRGLIFVCFNASIARQFEIVNSWLTDGDAFGLGRDSDILAGSRRPGRAVRMTIPGDTPVQFDSPKPLVRTRGGEYLFVPSLAALEELSDDAAIRP